MTLMTEPWHEWEDYNAGPYARKPIDPEMVIKSHALLSNPFQFLTVSHDMIGKWPIAAYHNLVELTSHRRSWTGQASCCYAHGATSAETIQAWGMLSNWGQDRANRIADQSINDYLRNGNAQTLFEL